MTSLVKKSIKRPLLSSREGNCTIGPLALNVLSRKMKNVDPSLHHFFSAYLLYKSHLIAA